MNILPLDKVDPHLVKAFTDNQIGADYYSVSEVEEMVRQSRTPLGSASFALLSQGGVEAIRISYPPGKWEKGKGQELSPQLWPWPIKQTAYFQSLFVAPAVQRQGWGTKLSILSLEVLQEAGAKGVVCHSWVESPGNSSQKYLLTLHFRSLCRYPNYWKSVDYTCPRCGNPCQCTAEEMYRDLKENPL